MATLSALATELLCHILKLLDPPSIRSVALVSRRFADLATEELRFRRKHQAISDQHPATVPSLLRDLVQGNYHTARCVQSIEIYGTRLTWDHWNDANVFNLTFPGGHDPSPAADAAAAQGYGPGFFDDRELGRFYHLMVDDLHLAPRVAERWRARIAEGNDAALKVLLIALCPQLKAVRFVQNADLDDHRPADQSPPETEREEIRSLLASAIASIFATAEKNWPPGFLSLEEVAIGVKSKSTAEPADAIPRSSSARIGTSVASRFFCLPNLKNTYIYGLTRVSALHSDSHNDYPWGPTAGCSSVQNILFDNPNEPEICALDAMFLSSGRTLRTIIFHGGTLAESFDLEMIFGSLEYRWDVVGLNGNPAGCLRYPEALLFCGTDVRGYRSTMYEPEYINVSVGTVHAEDVWLCFEDELQGDGKDELEVWNEKFPNYLRCCQVPVFNGEFDAEHEPMIDQQLAAFIREECGDWSDEDEEDEDEQAECGDEDGAGEGDTKREGEGEGDADDGGEQANNSNSNNADDIHSLRHLSNWPENIPEYTQYEYPKMTFYLTSLDEQREERTYRWWSKAIAAGKRNGIAVHTRTTKPPKRKDYGFHVQWPEGVADNILETSPWHGHASLPKVYFKPHVGFVEDCEHCGDCEECFKYYPPEVWAAIKKEEAEEDEEGEEGEEDEGSQKSE